MKSFGLICGGVILFGGGLFAGKLLFEGEGNSSASVSGQSEIRYRKRSISSSTKDQRRSELQAVRELPGHHESQVALVSLLWRILPDDPGAVMKMLDEVADLKQQTALAKAAAEAWIVSDPEAAISWVDARRAGSIKNVAALAMVERIGPIEPALAGRLFANLSSPGKYMSIKSLVDAWVEKDFAGAHEFVMAESNQRLFGIGFRSLLRKWGERNPREALSALEEVKSNLGKDDPGVALFEIAKGWARVDPVAALEWAKGLDPGPEFTGAAWTVLNTLVRNDPKAAIAALESISDRIVFPEGLAVEWAKYDVQAAKEWLMSLDSKPVDRDQAMGRMINLFASTDPWLSAELYNEFSPYVDIENGKGVSISQAVTAFSLRWQRASPEDAVRWAKSLPDGRMKNKIIRNFADRMSKTNPGEGEDLLKLVTPEE